MVSMSLGPDSQGASYPLPHWHYSLWELLTSLKKEKTKQNKTPQTKQRKKSLKQKTPGILSKAFTDPFFSFGQPLCVLHFSVMETYLAGLNGAISTQRWCCPAFSQVGVACLWAVDYLWLFKRKTKQNKKTQNHLTDFIIKSASRWQREWRCWRW